MTECTDLLGLNIRDLTKSYLETKERQKVLTDKFKALDKEYDAALELIGGALILKMEAEGVNSSPNEYGTPSISFRKQVSVLDAEAMKEFILESQDPDLLNNVVNKPTALRYIEEGRPIPGVAVTDVKTISVRRK